MIVGGLLVGTFFTLFVVPTAYTLLARRERAAHAADASCGGGGGSAGGVGGAGDSTSRAPTPVCWSKLPSLAGWRPLRSLLLACEDEGDGLVVHYAPDGQPWAWEIEGASRRPAKPFSLGRWPHVRAVRGLASIT